MYYIFLIAMIFIDQISKFIVRHNMELHQSFPLIGNLLEITYIENKGVAFSLFADSQNKIVLLFIPLVIIISLFIFYMKARKNYKGLFDISIMMIIAGGFSNLIDRFIFKSVTDFIDLERFAIFNIADIFAVVGCVLFIISIFFFEKKK